MSQRMPISNAELMSRDVEPLPTRPAVKFQDAARLSLADTQLRHNMGKATQTIRGRRAKVVEELPDWEALREAGRAIKDRTLRHLDSYLVQLERPSHAPGAWCTGRGTPGRPTGSSPRSSRGTGRRKWSRSSR